MRRSLVAARQMWRGNGNEMGRRGMRIERQEGKTYTAVSRSVSQYLNMSVCLRRIF